MFKITFIYHKTTKQRRKRTLTTKIITNLKMLPNDRISRLAQSQDLPCKSQSQHLLEKIYYNNLYRYLKFNLYPF